MKFNNSVISENTPRMGNVISRSIGSAVLRLMGWKVKGQLPNEKKVIIVGEPHTSNLDFIIAMASIQAVGLRVSYMMKKEAFFWPLGGFFKWMGGIPIDRSSGQDILPQLQEWLKTHDNVWLGVTPKGTRTAKDRYKSGYLRIAHELQIPMFLVGINGPTKEVILDKLIYPEGTIAQQNADIKAYYDSTFQGINPNNQIPGQTVQIKRDPLP